MAKVYHSQTNMADGIPEAGKRRRWFSLGGAFFTPA
jgi:hypothetical protein